ncbi:MAG TPA: response regulator [Bacteroidota bacterium]|nr:response regulator [Bacteroidota bacterium]
MPKNPSSPARRAILIVEDSTDFSNLLKFIVEDDGFTGVQFPLHSDDIVDWATKHQVAAILMDLALGRKGGMDFIEKLKADPDTAGIPIVIISGRDLPLKEIMQLQSQGIKYLRKGRVEMDEIREAIKDAAVPGGDRKK